MDGFWDLLLLAGDLPKLLAQGPLYIYLITLLCSLTSSTGGTPDKDSLNIGHDRKQPLNKGHLKLQTWNHIHETTFLEPVLDSVSCKRN